MTNFLSPCAHIPPISVGTFPPSASRGCGLPESSKGRTVKESLASEGRWGAFGGTLDVFGNPANTPSVSARTVRWPVQRKCRGGRLWWRVGTRGKTPCFVVGVGSEVQMDRCRDRWTFQPSRPASVEEKVALFSFFFCFCRSLFPNFWPPAPVSDVSRRT